MLQQIAAEEDVLFQPRDAGRQPDGSQLGAMCECARVDAFDVRAEDDVCEAVAAEENAAGEVGDAIARTFQTRGKGPGLSPLQGG